MAKRGLVNPKTHKTEDWNGNDLHYARAAAELYERAAEAPTRRLTARLIRRIKPKPH